MIGRSYEELALDIYILVQYHLTYLILWECVFHIITVTMIEHVNRFLTQPREVVLSHSI